IRNFQSLFTAHDCISNRPLDFELFKKLVKTFSVLSGVYAVGRCSEYSYSVFRHMLCKLDSCLSADRDHNSVWLFGIYYRNYVLVCQRLEIKSVGGIKVG